MPKQNRHDQAEIWSADQFEQVMGELSPKMRSLFSICYYTGCRVSEARQLRAEDVVGNTLVLRKATTKTKRTRAVPIHPKLKAVLAAADLPGRGYLFPGRSGDKPITRQACDLALRKACDRLGLRGYSTHSNRRTWATRLDKAGVRLKAIQDLGGWSSMAALQRYLEVSEEEKVEAIAQL
ncbi:site-specific integrase [Nodosilinea sp. LEGE 06152]|uniref:tyrosine-type recombinase/integrase n=1 Tax=Nodosilinea sp. LEGE 06152 TaxID=2777966 RepID=UPI001882D641|nr:site-specific integrase [Nodosilinea sp. LEGE 06152]MBE9160363.1 site-specific integrase [Nodosilinea sp. LEGE 06152]